MEICFRSSDSKLVHFFAINIKAKYSWGKRNAKIPRLFCPLSNGAVFRLEGAVQAAWYQASSDCPHVRGC